MSLRRHIFRKSRSRYFVYVTMLGFTKCCAKFQMISLNIPEDKLDLLKLYKPLDVT